MIADNTGQTRPGSLFAGRYRVGHQLGSGGWADVHAATDTTNAAEVALKIGRRDSAARTPTFLARFAREVALARRVEHPHVVAILDHGVADTGEPWLTMPRLEGRDLEAELRASGPLAPARARALLRPCLDALSLAHADGIVHRDLKPSNLFLTDDGDRLVLLDFGGAFQPEGPADTRLSTTGVMVGTPRYLAPEYIRTRRATPRSDVYQLGLVLSEMLSGTPVVDSDDVYACFQTHCEGRLSHTAQVRAGPFGSIIRKATATDPDARYPDAGALVKALDAAQAGPALVDHRPGSRRLIPWVATVSAIALALVVTALGIVLGPSASGSGVDSTRATGASPPAAAPVVDHGAVLGVEPGQPQQVRAVGDSPPQVHVVPPPDRAIPEPDRGTLPADNGAAPRHPLPARKNAGAQAQAGGPGDRAAGSAGRDPDQPRAGVESAGPAPGLPLIEDSPDAVPAVLPLPELR